MDEELQNPDNWDWDSAERKPGRYAERRELWRGRGITWTDNMRMVTLRVSNGNSG